MGSRESYPVPHGQHDIGYRTIRRSKNVSLVTNSGSDENLSPDGNARESVVLAPQLAPYNIHKSPPKDSHGRLVLKLGRHTRRQSASNAVPVDSFADALNGSSKTSTSIGCQTAPSSPTPPIDISTQICIVEALLDDCLDKLGTEQEEPTSGFTSTISCISPAAVGGPFDIMKPFLDGNNSEEDITDREAHPNITSCSASFSTSSSMSEENDVPITLTDDRKIFLHSGRDFQTTAPTKTEHMIGDISMEQIDLIDEGETSHTESNQPPTMEVTIEPPAFPPSPLTAEIYDESDRSMLVVQERKNAGSGEVQAAFRSKGIRRSESSSSESSGFLLDPMEKQTRNSEHYDISKDKQGTHSYSLGNNNFNRSDEENEISTDGEENIMAQFGSAKKSVIFSDKGQVLVKAKDSATRAWAKDQDPMQYIEKQIKRVLGEGDHIAELEIVSLLSNIDIDALKVWRAVSNGSIMPNPPNTPNTPADGKEVIVEDDNTDNDENQEDHEELNESMDYIPGIAIHRKFSGQHRLSRIRKAIESDHNRTQRPDQLPRIYRNVQRKLYTTKIDSATSGGPESFASLTTAIIRGQEKLENGIESIYNAHERLSLQVINTTDHITDLKVSMEEHQQSISTRKEDARSLKIDVSNLRDEIAILLTRTDQIATLLKSIKESNIDNTIPATNNSSHILSVVDKELILQKVIEERKRTTWSTMTSLTYDSLASGEGQILWPQGDEPLLLGKRQCECGKYWDGDSPPSMSIWEWLLCIIMGIFTVYMFFQFIGDSILQITGPICFDYGCFAR